MAHLLVAGYAHDQLRQTRLPAAVLSQGVALAIQKYF
jgi:hypothetical protein